MTSVGVVAVQGDVSEHVVSCREALEDLGRSGEVVEVRRPGEVEPLDAVVLPGGESTTIGRLVEASGLGSAIRRRAEEGMPVLGTCAGCILVASSGDAQVEETDTPLLGLMDMAVERNAFGRQRESFQAPLELDGIGSFPGVFIRAPAIRETWGGCRSSGRLGDAIVMAEQGPHVAATFHPELTGDVRVHRRFLERV